MFSMFLLSALFVPVLSLGCLFSPVFKYLSAAVIPVVEHLAEIFSFLLFPFLGEVGWVGVGGYLFSPSKDVLLKK